MNKNNTHTITVNKHLNILWILCTFLYLEKKNANAIEVTVKFTNEKLSK